MSSKPELDEKGILFQCVEGSNDAVMLTDIRGVIFYVNKAWEVTYGYKKEEAIGKTPRLLRSHQQETVFYQKMWKEILDPSKGFWKGELINRAKDGKEVPVLLTITPFKDESQKIIGYMGIALDISEKKKMEAEMIQKDRLASIGVLAAGLAHEIGTPLGTIRGRAELILKDLNDSDQHRNNIETIVHQIDRISKLMFSLLDLARRDRSEDSEAIFVRSVLEDVFNLISEKLEKHRISYESDLAPAVKVKAERAHLGQVVLNVVTNAVHAIESAIENGRSHGHLIRINKKDRGEHWELIIRDTGCGMTKENMNHLFRPFFTTKDVGMGTGLGLPIAYQLVQSWGGSLHIESTTGIGTTVKVILPKKGH